METIWNLLDFSGNGIFNSLDLILWWSYSLMAIIFYKTVIKKVLGIGKEKRDHTY